MGETNLVHKPLGGMVAGTAVGVGYLYMHLFTDTDVALDLHCYEVFAKHVRI